MFFIANNPRLLELAICVLAHYSSLKFIEGTQLHLKVLKENIYLYEKNMLNTLLNHLYFSEFSKVLLFQFLKLHINYVIYKTDTELTCINLS